MPFLKTSDAELDRIADEVLAALRRSDLHPLPQTQGLTFSDIERTAHAVGQRVAAKLTAQTLAHAAEELDEFATCPQCHNRTRLTRKKRIVRTLDGPVEYLEPAAHCLGCRRDFFPSASAAPPE